MSDKKLYLKGVGNLKVLAKDGLNPYYGTISCPCNDEPLTGKWFIDYYEYYPQTKTEFEIYNFPQQFNSILQTDDIQGMQSGSVGGDWKPSALLFNQDYYWIQNIYDASNSILRLRTREVEVSGNNFILNQPMYKQYAYWSYPQDADYCMMVSGDSSSGVAFNYNLSTICQDIVFSISMQNGLISSFIINNVDNNVVGGELVTSNSIIQYSLQAQEGNNYPILKEQYIPMSDKLSAINQYYLERKYKGTQYGYVFTSNLPTDYSWEEGINLVDNMRTIGGDDNIPTPGKTIYLEEGSIHGSLDWHFVVKQSNNKFYRVNWDNYRTLIEIPSSHFVSAAYNDPPTELYDSTRFIESGYFYDQYSNQYISGLVRDVFSATVQYDQPQVIQILTGMWALNPNSYRYSNYPSEEELHITSTGILINDNNILDQWNNQKSDPNLNYNDLLHIYDQNNASVTGQYIIMAGWAWFHDDYWESNNNIEWQYYLGFVKDYDSNTSSILMDIYKFGEDYNDYSYISSYFGLSSIEANVFGYNEAESEYNIPTYWNSVQKHFYNGYQGTDDNNHPDYTNWYFEVPQLTGVQQQTGMVRFNIFTAPKWGAMRQLDHDYYWLDDNCIVTGDSYNSLRVWYIHDGEAPEDMWQEENISSLYWTYTWRDGVGHDIKFVSNSGAYWVVNDTYSYVSGTQQQLAYIDSDTIVESGFIDEDQIYISATLNYYPLTGGTFINCQKSIAVDDPNRPPYWFFHNNQKETPSDIFSGRCFKDYYDNYKTCIIVPIYYDSVYGHKINTYSTQNWLPSNYAAILEPYRRDPSYYNAKYMINDVSYEKCNPFIDYIRTEYRYSDAQEDPTIQYFFNHFTSAATNNEHLFKYRWDWNSNSWGAWNTPEDYSIKTFMFKKMTSSQIQDWYDFSVLSEPAAEVNNIDLSKYGYGTYSYNNLTNLNCQIITGFWIKRAEDGDDSNCGIRKYGFFNQTLDFDTEYTFGYSLSSVSELDDLLNSDTSVCYMKVNNALVATHVNDYWNNYIKNTIQSNSQITEANFNAFQSFAAIRVINGNYTLQIQP